MDYIKQNIPVAEITNQKIELYKNDYKLSDTILFIFNDCTFGYHDYDINYNPLNINKKSFIEYDNNVVEEILNEYGFKYSINSNR